MPQFSTLWGFAFLSLLFSAEVGAAQDRNLVSFHSARGDQVDLVIGTRLSGGFPQKLVRVCLENPSQNLTEKGLGNHRGAKPDLVLAIGKSGCIDLSPARQNLVFWSPNTTGGFDISLIASLDLRDKTGYIYFLRWSKEPSQNR